MNILTSEVPSLRGPDAPPPRGLAFSALLASAVLVPIAILLAGAWFAWSDISRQSRTELAGAADAASEFAARLLDGQAQLADRIDDLLLRLPDPEIRADEPRLRASLQALAAARHQVAGVMVVDARGQRLLASGAEPDAADEALLAALRDPAAPPVAIGELGGTGSGHRFLHIAFRREREAPPPFRGAVLILLRQQDIAARLQEIGMAPHDAITLLRADGAVIASDGRGGGRAAAPAAEDTLQAAMREGERVMVERPRGIGGEPSTAALRRAAGWPVFARAERLHRDMVARWRGIVLWQAGFGIPAALMLLGLVVLTFRHSRDAAAARAALELEAARRLAAEAVRESEDRYRAFSAAIREGVAIHDHDRIVDANDAFWRMFGHASRQEVIGRHPLDFIEPSARPDARARMEKEWTEPYETLGLRADGTIFPAEFHGQPILYRGCRMRVGVVRDLTQQHAVQAALRESEPRLRQMLATLDLGAFMARRPDGTITSWSAGCERLYGWTAAEALGRVSHELLGTVFPGPLAEIEAALAKDGEWTGLLRQRNRDGDEVAIAVHKALQRDEAGGPGTILESMVDVSGQQRAEAQLRSILETVPDAMIVINERGGMISFSTAAERLFGWRASEVIGRNVSILMPNPDRARHDTYLSRYLATGERHIIGLGREVTGQRRDGTTFPMELSVGEVSTGGHRLFTGFVRDLSERQEQQQRLQSVQSELLHVSRLSAAGEMASALAHELNQPLTAIASSVRAALRMLQDMPDSDALPPRVVEAMERAAGQSMRAGQIVRRLREFVLKGEVERQLADLSQLIEEAAALALVGARQLGVHVTFRLDPGPMAVVVAPIQIQQVVLNLIRNAIDAMTEPAAASAGARREMVISTSRPDASSVEVVVADTGPGLAPEIVAKLFEPFVTTKAGGMGVGLSISRSIIETHGGRLWAQPNPVGGTIFRFTLPAGPAMSGDETP